MSEFRNKLGKLTQEHAVLLVETYVKGMSEKTIIPRERLFFELEPFLREFEEYRVNDPKDGRNEFGFTANYILSTAKGVGKKYRASLFAWLCFYHREEAINFTNDILELNGPSLILYESHPELSKCSENARKILEALASNNDEKNTTSTDTEPVTTPDHLMPLINGYWQPQHILPAPQADEQWLIVHEWTPSMAPNFGILSLWFKAKPLESGYSYFSPVWTGDYIRTLIQRKTLVPALFSFGLGNKKGNFLFHREATYGTLGQVISKTHDSESFIFCDELCIGYYKNPEDDRYERSVFYKPVEESCQSTYLLTRHPTLLNRDNKPDAEGHYEVRQNIVSNSDGTLLVFSCYGNPNTDQLDAVELFEIVESRICADEDAIKRIEVWSNELYSENDFLAHPKIKDTFFVAPNNLRKLNSPKTEILDGKKWHVMGDRSKASWHPEFPFILINAKLKGNPKQDYLIVVDVDTNKSVHEQKLTGPLGNVVWSPNGKSVYYSTSEFTLHHWNLETDTVQRKFNNNGKVSKLAFSPTGDRIAVQGWGEKNMIAIFSSQSFELVANFFGNFAGFQETPWHYKGRHIAYVNDEKLCVRQLKF